MTFLQLLHPHLQGFVVRIDFQRTTRRLDRTGDIFERIQASSQALFHDLFREFPLSDGSVFDHKAWAPAVDVEEREDAYVVTADVPGLDRKDVKVTHEDGVLTISGERKLEPQDGGERHRVERVYGAFSRSFNLPPAADAGKVRAAYKEGVLTVIIPKREEAKTRRIEVKVE